MKNLVRVRFAPSPTGLLHVGGLRTALFNYLFAKHHNGSFILRLEDTDRERFVNAGVAQIQQSLAWLDLVPDEGYWLGEHKGDLGPYVQSERLPHYERFAKQLVASGLAYYSRISADDFLAHKQKAIAAKTAFVYRQNLEPTDDGKTEDYPIRLKIKPGLVKWQDEIRGDFTIDSSTIDDFVIMKADGYPTYNFASVIDDHLMQISHVIRGDEFIASTPKHILLYKYFSFDVPKFAHLPTILGADGTKKLSKRDGEVDVLEYKQKGYLPEALLNFLALLGWNDGTEQEIFDLAQLIAKFDLSRVQKSPAVFDRTRLDWMNGEYIRALSIDELAHQLQDFVPQDWYKDQAYFKQVVSLDRERFKTLAQAKELMDFFFEAITVDRSLLCKNDNAAEVAKWLSSTTEVIKTVAFNHDQLEAGLRQLAEKLQLQTKQLFYVLRVALTGRTVAPGLFDTMVTLGRDKVLTRLEAARKICLTDK